MPSAAFLSEIAFQCSVNRILIDSGARGGDGPVLTAAELRSLAIAYQAGETPANFAARVEGGPPAHRSQWQRNATAPDSFASCSCGHAKHQHDDDGRCRSRRHRCECREFVAQRAQRGAA